MASPVAGPSPVGADDSHFAAVSRGIQETPVLGFIYGLGAQFGREGRAENASDFLRTSPGLSGAYESGKLYESRTNAEYLGQKAAERYEQEVRAGRIVDDEYKGTEEQYASFTRVMNAASTARVSNQALEAQVLGNQTAPVTMPLALWAMGAGEWIPRGGTQLIQAGDATLPAAAPLTHFVVGAGEGVAQLVPFVAMALPAAEWAVRNPAAMTAAVLPGTAMMVEGMVGLARSDAPRFAGNIAGMIIGPKVAGRVAGSVVNLGRVDVLTGDYWDYLGTQPIMNRYTILATKAPWQTWGASGRAVVTVAQGAEYGRPQVVFGSTGLQLAIAGTNVRMASPWDIQTTVASPQTKVFTRNLVEAGRPTNPELADLYQSFEGTLQTVSNPIQRALFYRPAQVELFGELPTASASKATMAEIFRSAETRGDIVFSGSRANIRPFTAPYARGAQKFGGTMADFDVLMSETAMQEIYVQWKAIVAKQHPEVEQFSKFKTTKEGHLRFSISTGRGIFINAETFAEFSNVPRGRFNTMTVEAVGGAKVRIPGPAHALEAKMSGATRDAIITHTPSEGARLHLTESIRAKDWPDLTSTARGMARDLYTPVRADIQGLSGRGILQSMKTARAEAAESLSDISRTFAEKHAPGTSAMYREFGPDILRGINRTPEPLYSLSPVQTGAGVAMGAAMVAMPGAIPPILKFALLGIATDFRKIPTETYKVRTGTSGTGNKYVPDRIIQTPGDAAPGTSYINSRGPVSPAIARSLGQTEIYPSAKLTSPNRFVGLAGLGSLGSAANTRLRSEPQGLRRESYPSAHNRRTPGEVYYGKAAEAGRAEIYPALTVARDYPAISLLTDEYPTITTYNPPAVEPPYVPPIEPPYTSRAEPPYTPPIEPPYVPPFTPQTPPPWAPTNTPQYPPGTPPIRLTDITRNPDRDFTWWKDKKKKKPVRFMELFSFEMGTDSPVPRRFGRGGVTPAAIAKNPLAKFIPGYRGVAGRRLAPEDIAPNRLFDILGTGKGPRRRPTYWEDLLS
jgi:hypothetical protein